MYLPKKLLLVLAVFCVIPLCGITAKPSANQTNKPIVFAGVGDIMLGSTFPSESLPPNDGADMLKEVAPILSAADIAFGNLEGPMLEGGVSTKCGKSSANCYAFRVPTRYGQHLKNAGIDVMSLANNHAGDFGTEGLNSSKKVLDGLGIAHSAEVGDIARLTVRGRKISLIAFATNNIALNLNDTETAKRVVAEENARANIVIVSFHGGAEGTANQHVPDRMEVYLGESRGHLRKFTHAVIDAGADLVIGHGPHVCRAMEVYKNRLIAYSLGNFATFGKFNLSAEMGLSMILEVSLNPTDGTFRGGRIHPVKQIKPGGPHFDSEKAIIPIVKQLTQTDFATTGVRINDDGTIALP